MDLGDEGGVLSRYGAERWAKGMAVGGVCDVLSKGFGVTGGVAGWLRGVGMGVLGTQGGVVGRGVKEWVMGMAEG